AYLVSELFRRGKTRARDDEEDEPEDRCSADGDPVRPASPARPAACRQRSLRIGAFSVVSPSPAWSHRPCDTTPSGGRDCYHPFGEVRTIPAKPGDGRLELECRRRRDRSSTEGRDNFPRTSRSEADIPRVACLAHLASRRAWRNLPRLGVRT